MGQEQERLHPLQRRIPNMLEAVDRSRPEAFSGICCTLFIISDKSN